MATALLAITVVAELRLTKLRGGIKSPPTPPRPQIPTHSGELYLCDSARCIHDAVNAIEPRYEPYLPRTSQPPTGASVEAAIGGAAHETLVALLPESKASFDAALEDTLRLSDDSRKTAGLEWDELRRGNPQGTRKRRSETNRGVRRVRRPAATARRRRTLNRQLWCSGGA